MCTCRILVCLSDTLLKSVSRQMEHYKYLAMILRMISLTCHKKPTSTGRTEFTMPFLIDSTLQTQGAFMALFKNNAITTGFREGISCGKSVLLGHWHWTLSKKRPEPGKNGDAIRNKFSYIISKEVKKNFININVGGFAFPKLIGQTNKQTPRAHKSTALYMISINITINTTLV